MVDRIHTTKIEGHLGATRHGEKGLAAAAWRAQQALAANRDTPKFKNLLKRLKINEKRFSNRDRPGILLFVGPSATGPNKGYDATKIGISRVIREAEEKATTNRNVT
jgi:hypothetical protein